MEKILSEIANALNENDKTISLFECGSNGLLAAAIQSANGIDGKCIGSLSIPQLSEAKFFFDELFISEDETIDTSAKKLAESMLNRLCTTMSVGSILDDEGNIHLCILCKKFHSIDHVYKFVRFDENVSTTIENALNAILTSIKTLNR